MKVSKHRIYLDNAATTPIDPRVEKEMKRFWSGDFGNAGSIHKEGVVAKQALENARQKVAELIGAHRDEIFFTSSGTMSNNMAIIGSISYSLSHGEDPKNIEIISTEIEHSSILEPIMWLCKKKIRHHVVKVNKEGIADLNLFKRVLHDKSALVSIHYVNNEIGVIQPISKISKIIRQRNFENISLQKRPIIFHVDASQAPLYCDLNVQKIGADLLTLDGQKIYGPKGIGVLYKKRSVKIEPIFFGGGQERGMHSGTENIAAIVGLATALEIAVKERDRERARISKLRDYFWDRIRDSLPSVVLNGSLENRVANNINFSVPNIDPEFIVLELDARGIACSTKSTCVKAGDQSYVVAAIAGEDRARSSLRFSLGRYTTKKEIDFTVNALIEIISKST